MSTKVKKSIFVRLRNYFITGAIVLIPIGITIYLTLFIIKISSSVLPKTINPNSYLPFNIPGIEILITIILITLIGGLSLSFFGNFTFVFLCGEAYNPYTFSWIFNYDYTFFYTF